ncbi:hypothetical protein [Micromonospora arborensis]
MSLVAHARREPELSGQFAEDPAYAQAIVPATPGDGPHPTPLARAVND